MDWDRYKTLCDTPDVCSRWLLEQTLELLEASSVSRKLEDALRQPPIDKPDDHEGGPETDMFRLSLGLEDVRAVRERVEQAQAAGETTAATRDRGLGGFVETWREYEQQLERQTR